MNGELANALGVLLAACLTALTPTLVLLATRAGKYLANVAELKLTEKQEQEIRRAVETGVAAAEEYGRKQLAAAADRGALKLEHAKQIARSLAPKALAKLDDRQLEEVVNAGVARMRPSLSTPTTSSAPPPLSVVVADMPTSATPRASMPESALLGEEPLARPPRVPSEGVGVQARNDDPITPSERPSAKRSS